MRLCTSKTGVLLVGARYFSTMRYRSATKRVLQQGSRIRGGIESLVWRDFPLACETVRNSCLRS